MFPPFRTILSASAALLLLVACSKGKSDPSPVEPYKLSYGDSTFYVKNQATDYIIKPLQQKTGKYFGFPEGVEIDDENGEINISKTETGLRYKISFVPAGTTDTFSTIILISGINYYDKIYDLSANDTLAHPVYNANVALNIPANSAFDEGGGCNGQGIAVDTENASINLAATIRSGTFGATPANGSQKEVELLYRVNDGSSNALNKLRVKVYYFNTSADITPDLIQLITDRQGTILEANPGNGISNFLFGQEIISGINGTGGIAGVAKPRPPCIFIVGRL